MFRRTLPGKQGAFIRPFQALKHLAGNTFCGFFGRNPLQAKPPDRIKLGVCWPKFQSAGRDHPPAAPFSVGQLEDLFDLPLGQQVPLRSDRSGVGVFHFMPPLFQLTHTTTNSAEDIDGLKSGHHDRLPVFCRYPSIAFQAHDSANMPGCASGV